MTRSPIASIASIATATPSFRMTQDEWLAIAERLAGPEVDRRLLARLAERSGIASRACAAFEPGFEPLYRPGKVPGTAERMALWARAARATSLEASARALAEAKVAPHEVTHVVTASCTGFESPGIDAHLIGSLGLPRQCHRLNVGFMGCHAAVNALSAARAAVIASTTASDAGAVALVCCAEVSSAHLHADVRPDRLVANTLFADGCAAIVVRGSDRAPGVGVPTIAATASTVIPDTQAEMAWTIGDRGFEMTLGGEVPAILEREVGVWVRAALAGHGLRIADIGAWAIHPGGPRVIDAVLAALDLPPAAGEASREVLRAHGNMSSATLLFILARLRASGAPLPWVGLAFGPGLVGELILIDG